jgi:hypothetical protein
LPLLINHEFLGRTNFSWKAATAHRRSLLSICEELTAVALSLRERVGLGPRQRFRLADVGLSNFFEPEDLSAQSALFE